MALQSARKQFWQADQYTGTPDEGGEAEDGAAGRSVLRQLTGAHDGVGVCYMLLCRTMLGYAQRTVDGNMSMDAFEDVFAMGGFKTSGGAGALKTARPNAS